MTFQIKPIIGEGHGSDYTTAYSSLSSADTNLTLVRHGPGVLASIAAFNLSESVRYLKFYDIESLPLASGTGTPLRRFAIPASTTGKGFVYSPAIPIDFYRGLAFTITGGVADNDSTSVSVNDVILTLECTPGLPDGRPSTAGFYTTTFSTIEAPLLEGGRWQRGLAEGVLWNDPKITANGCVGSVQAGLGATRYDDDIAHLKKTFIDFENNHYAQATVYRAGGYNPGGISAAHEIELLLRFEITASGARGYECLWGENSSGGYYAVVRWNGGLGSFDELWSTSPVAAPADGDVFRAEIVGTNILTYKNSVLFHTTDVTALGGTTWTEGQPGLGFWPIDGATPASEGFKNFTAGNL